MGSVCATLYNNMEECFPCDYTSFYQPSSSSINDSIQCIQKINETINVRKILILNSLIPSLEKQAFSVVYFDYIDALIRESKLALTYFKSTLTFYFSSGNHTNKTLSSNVPSFYFRRTAANITLKSLLCEEFNISGCLNEINAPTIFLSTLSFNLYVSEKFFVENLIFDTSFNKESIGSIGIPSYQIDPEINGKIKFGMFNLEAIFDDPDCEAPSLQMRNVSFFNFLGNRNKFQMFTIIENSIYGGEIILENAVFKNIHIYFGIVHFENINLVTPLYATYRTSINPVMRTKLYQIINFNLNFSNVLVYNDDNPNMRDDNLPFFFVYLENWLGLVEFRFLELRNIFGNNTNQYALFFSNVFDVINLENVYVQSFFNISLIYVVETTITITNITIIDYIQNSNCFIFFDTQTFATITQMVFQKQNMSSATFFLEAVESFMFLSSIYLIDVNAGNFYLLKSHFNLSESLFVNIYNSDNFILFDQSESSVKDTLFSNIVCNQNLLFFYGNTSEIIRTNFTQISCSSIILPTKLDYQLLDSCLFYNLSSAFNIWSYNSVLFALTINDTQFVNSTIYAFLFILSNQLLANFNNLSIIDIDGKSPNIFLAIMTYSIVVMKNCYFRNISFSLGTAHIFEVDFSVVYMDSCSFYNVGWKKFQIQSFLSSEDNNLCYFWAHREVVVQNSNFYQDAYSLYSGFLFLSIGTENVVLINNTFKAKNQNPEWFYQGVVISDASFVQIINSTFEGLICSIPNSSYLRKFDGPVNLNGESGTFLIKNQKILSMLNNTFSNCSCQGKGGSLSIMNYDISYLNNLNVFGSKGTKGGVRGS